MKHDSMFQYVAGRAPHLATPRRPRRVRWTLAAETQDARQRAEESTTRTPAPVFHLAEARLARHASSIV